MAIEYFVPGVTPLEAGLLGGLIAAWPESVARRFIEEYAHLDAIVWDPFAFSDVPIREGLAAGRRMIATHSNPLVALLLRQRLSPPDPAALKSAMTRLGDSLKRGVLLREHLDNLYRTRCPACRHPAVAEYFIWSREPADPRQKWVVCPACGQAGLAAVEDEDLAALDEVEIRGLHYWYLLNRVASPATDEGGARAEKLMELYTPRAVYAIADLLMRIEAGFDEETQTVLKAVLLRCLGPASSLYAPETAPDAETDGGDTRSVAQTNPDRLEPPPRFIERNVWRLFEATVQRMAGSAAARGAIPLQADLHWAVRAPASPEGLVWVHNLTAGAVARGLPPESVSLVLTSPPQPDPVFWSLAYVWTGWLFGAAEAGKLKGLALQKWPDWAWYQSTLAAALRAVRPVFRFDGVCVLVLPDALPQQASAVLLAALAAGYRVESWQVRGAQEHQFSLALDSMPTVPSEAPETLQARVAAESRQAAVDLLRAYGEPVETEMLHVAAWYHLLEKGVLPTALASLAANRVLAWLQAAIGKGLEADGQPQAGGQPQAAGQPQAGGQPKAAGQPQGLPLRVGEEGLSVAGQPQGLPLRAGDEGRPVGWWLNKVSRKVPSPLGDRVEEAVLRALRALGEVDAKGGAPVEEAGLLASLYRRFNGLLTPNAGLVHACLLAYGEETLPGFWRLRPGEREEAWRASEDAVVRDLLGLGERLGYQAHSAQGDCDVVWEEQGRPWATFKLAATAYVAGFLPHLDAARPQPDLRWRHLVIPAARAGLWQHRLATQAWLAQAMNAGRWTFIKWEHVQALAGRGDVTLHELKAIVGLVPPVESGEGQLPLF